MIRSVGLLQRFGDDGSKDARHVAFGETLNFASCNGTDAKYKLESVVVHQGVAARCGHYYTFLHVGGSWYKFDDENVTKVGWLDVARSQAYVLIFRRTSPETCIRFRPASASSRQARDAVPSADTAGGGAGGATGLSGNVVLSGGLVSRARDVARLENTAAGGVALAPPDNLVPSSPGGHVSKARGAALPSAKSVEGALGRADPHVLSARGMAPAVDTSARGLEASTTGSHNVVPPGDLPPGASYGRISRVRGASPPENTAAGSVRGRMASLRDAASTDDLTLGTFKGCILRAAPPADASVGVNASGTLETAPPGHLAPGTFMSRVSRARGAVPNDETTAVDETSVKGVGGDATNPREATLPDESAPGTFGGCVSRAQTASSASVERGGGVRGSWSGSGRRGAA